MIDKNWIGEEGEDEIYRENILDHYKHPRNFGVLKSSSFHHRESNPVCGDVIEIHVLVTEGKVAAVKFDGKGCAISMASASMLTEKLRGMAVADVKKLTEHDIFDMLGITLDASRIKCGTLSLKTVLKGIKSMEEQK